MTKIEEVIDNAIHFHWIEGADTGDDKSRVILRQTILSALDAAGYAVVPKDPDETMLEKGRKAWKAQRLHVSHQGSDEFMTCGVIYRAMIKAAKGEWPTNAKSPRRRGGDEGAC